ncbi:MAG: GNAT family N-acetyltransferase, partial [Nocardioides sp.]
AASRAALSAAARRGHARCPQAGLVILLATAEDLPRLVELDGVLLGGEAWSAASWEAELASPNRRVLVAQDDVGAIVGFADWLLGDVLELLRIGVSSTHQRRGVAGSLLDAGVLLGREAGLDRVFLEVSADNAAAVGFYRAHQFVTIDRRPRYYRDGSDALVMERLLE